MAADVPDSEGRCAVTADAQSLQCAVTADAQLLQMRAQQRPSTLGLRSMQTAGCRSHRKQRIEGGTGTECSRRLATVHSIESAACTVSAVWGPPCVQNRPRPRQMRTVTRVPSTLGDCCRSSVSCNKRVSYVGWDPPREVRAPLSRVPYTMLVYAPLCLGTN